MQCLNLPLGIRCHLVEQTILLECHYVFAHRKRIKQIPTYAVHSLTLVRAQWNTVVVSGVVNNPAVAGRVEEPRANVNWQNGKMSYPICSSII